MAVGSHPFPEMPVIDGLELACVSAGIKANGNTDLVLIALPEGSTVAGVFTRNAFCAAPVQVCREHLSVTSASRYLLINSGNANACTGEQGMAAALQSCTALATTGGVKPEQVLPFSTGVIGEPLPIEKIVAALPQLIAGLDANHWSQAAEGIMTTDTRPKGASRTLEIAAKSVVINGIAKGAGMINPDMATMLAYVGSDIGLSEPCSRQLLGEVADLSFNRITIDGDTSTNDSCMLMATGGSGVMIDDIASDDYRIFKAALLDVLGELAQAIVKDAEGATKFLTVSVEQGASTHECLEVAYAIAHSPLVKTALFASDPNWGRIVCAIGYAGVPDLDVSQVNVWLGDVLIVEQGGRATSYTEERGQAVMDQEEILLRVELGRGDVAETLWTSDLSHEYVRINAEYRS